MMAEGTEKKISDSWGMELMRELLGRFTYVTGRITDDHSGNQNEMNVSKKTVAKKLVKRVRDDRCTNLPSISMDNWCKERQAKGYGPKIAKSRVKDSIEKEKKVEIKVEQSLKSSDMTPVQRMKSPTAPSSDSRENCKISVKDSSISSSDTLENNSLIM